MVGWLCWWCRVLVLVGFVWWWASLPLDFVRSVVYGDGCQQGAGRVQEVRAMDSPVVELPCGHVVDENDVAWMTWGDRAGHVIGRVPWCCECERMEREADGRETRVPVRVVQS